MVLGMPPLTFIHVVISLIGIGSGLVVLAGMLNAQRLDSWTATFLSTTVLTSLTGFLLPAPHFLPSHAIGILSIVVLAVAIAARYSFHLAGGWRTAYVVTASIALYFNVFVLIVQSFLKVPSLHALAPTQSEPPFAIAQGTVLILFVALTILAVKRFHPEPFVQARTAAAR
ncbi:MAG: hypothetical protein LAO79_06725 [Acidobacteriia bacterium]|nr:hypothetical protein [Terriglobia bacterium]